MDDEGEMCVVSVEVLSQKIENLDVEREARRARVFIGK